MASALRLLFLLCGLSGLLTGVESYPTSYSKRNDCPQEWTQLDSKCYIFENEPRTFSDAESVCNILGGNLASILNGLENAIVLEVFRAGGEDTEAWIGFFDSLEADNYIWTDGSDGSFTNFDTRATTPEPNSATGNCVELDRNDGFWQTRSCSDDNVFICIRDVHHPH
ncbi:galactose-specific lectin nattectin-like [Syngnathoides biaculeatus]|uniref:galactose-specific lectin nattectin-like n=1 Tax=Syngnathoides biaculeatus TaxID=300417 RepID=UPI002ADE6726|nr:galactose-specific lectin nattectin-like [Syngnathoides biaculeatus]